MNYLIYKHAILISVIYLLINIAKAFLFKYIFKGELDIKIQGDLFAIYYKYEKIYFNFLEVVLLSILFVVLINIHIYYNKNYFNLLVIIVITVLIVPFNKKYLSKYSNIPICSMVIYNNCILINNNYSVIVYNANIKIVVEHHATQRGSLFYNLYVLLDNKSKISLIENVIKPDLDTIIEKLIEYTKVNDKNLLVSNDYYSSTSP